MQNSAVTGLEILIVEDELLLRKQIVAGLEALGASVTAAGTFQTAKKFVEELSFDVVLLDVNLPDGLGIDLLKAKAIPANTAAIVMTAEGKVTGAVEAMRLGASDYLVKPFDPAELPLVISRARRATQAKRIDEHRRSDPTQSGDTFYFGATLKSLETQLSKILTADRRLEMDLPPVLIQGETGTGKSTIARWLHYHGPRAEKELVEVNCSALPETLAESELFGHERGAFTDARTARIGLFEAAHGGTLFLDELPSLSAPLQAKVLTAIEDHKIRRLGGNKPIPVDVRIIAATNRDLKQLVADGEFREDLYHRLDLYRLAIVPLRDRGDDIISLAHLFVTRLCQRHRLQERQMTELGKNRLRAYPWPGNVRELAHEIERAIVFEESPELDFAHLTGSRGMVRSSQDPADWFNESYVFPPEGFAMEEATNRILQHALKQTNQNVSAAARLLGVTRDYVRYRLAGQKVPEQMGASAQ